MFQSLSSYWGFTIPLLCYVAIDKRLGAATFILTVVIFTLSQISIYSGHLQHLNQRNTTLIVELLHLIFIVFFTHYSMSRFSKLIKIPIEVIQESLDKEHQLNIIKDTFLSNISHELRTPLNGIYGALQLVRGETDTEKQLLKSARHSASALNRIVSDILDVQKLDEGKMLISPDWFASKLFFENLNHLYTSQAKLKGIAFNLHINQRMPPALLGDELRIGQVLNNILSNAIKFTERGAITLHADYDNNQLKIVISDSGIGMDKKAMILLFDRFTQADTSITKKYAGTGLGMAISKELVTLMGGTIDVSSTPNQGTTFSVFLPLKGRQQHIVKESNQSINPLLFKELRILFVDDAETNILVGKVYLAKYFTSIETALSAQEALDKIKQQDFDLLITDIGMPIMSGEDLFATVKSQLPDLPVIALTGNAREADKEKYLNLGFDGVATKPLQIEELVSLIQRIFESRLGHNIE